MKGENTDNDLRKKEKQGKISFSLIIYNQKSKFNKFRQTIR